METIKSGYGVLRFNHYWFRCPDVGTNKGGLFDLYKEKRDRLWAETLVKKWFPYAKVVIKNNRVDAKIDVKGFAKSLNKTVI